MDDLTAQGTLELDVANFGPIIEANIDLRPLTVFVGPSNTGKSWLAILVYALHQHFGNNHGFGRRRSSIPFRMIRGDREQFLGQRTIDALAQWAKQTFADRQRPLDGRTLVLPVAVMDEIRSLHRARGDAFGRAFGGEMVRCFGTEELAPLVRKGNKEGARVTLKRHLNDSASLEHEWTLKAPGIEYRSTIPGETQVRISTEDRAYPMEYLARLAENNANRGERRFLAERLLDILHALALPQLVGSLHLPAYYLPADRTGVMHAHNVVVSALIESASMTGLRPATRTPMLSGVLADFLEHMIDLDHMPPYSRHRQHKRPPDVATQIENTIIAGSVRINRSEASGYPRFTYRPRGWKDELPLMRASSMVSELAPVVLYLRHMVLPGNLLIIEEPESHLHPAMQVEFTRQIAALVQSGIRVMVTTHSEWVLEELANIVRRSRLPAARRKEAGSEVALPPSQVGAWLFQPKRRPKGSTVKEIRLDDSGLYPAGFDEVATALHNNWAEISSRMEEAK